MSAQAMRKQKREGAGKQAVPPHIQDLLAEEEAAKKRGANGGRRTSRQRR